MLCHKCKNPAPTESTQKVFISQTWMGYKCSCAKPVILMKPKISDKKWEKFNCMNLTRQGGIISYFKMI